MFEANHLGAGPKHSTQPSKLTIEVVDADRNVSKLAKLAADLPTARCCSSRR
jgi:hypothetical protein